MSGCAMNTKLDARPRKLTNSPQDGQWIYGLPHICNKLINIILIVYMCRRWTPSNIYHMEKIGILLSPTGYWLSDFGLGQGLKKVLIFILLLNSTSLFFISILPEGLKIWQSATTNFFCEISWCRFGLGSWKTLVMVYYYN